MSNARKEGLYLDLDLQPYQVKEPVCPNSEHLWMTYLRQLARHQLVPRLEVISFTPHGSDSAFTSLAIQKVSFPDIPSDIDIGMDNYLCVDGNASGSIISISTHSTQDIVPRRPLLFGGIQRVRTRGLLRELGLDINTKTWKQNIKYYESINPLITQF